MFLPKPTPAYSYARRTPSFVRKVPCCRCMVVALRGVRIPVGEFCQKG